MNVHSFKQKKQAQEKISMVTCYDYTSARILAETSIDCLLIGDSVAMTMHGYKDTIAATVPMMCLHTQAVARGAGSKFIISDLPFLSYRKNLKESIDATQQLIQSGAHAIKIEGAQGNEDFIRHVSESGVPVVGHIGLTPQFINSLGGFKVQGKSQESQEKLIQDALKLQDSGCFALVLECMPALFAKEITALLHIPTIGVGAGPFTDGQVLVWQDLLGLNIDFQPKFAKAFMPGAQHIKQSIECFIQDAKARVFPANEHCY